MELNFIDSLVQVYVDIFHQVNTVRRYQYINGKIETVDVQVKQFPEELKPALKTLIAAELDKLGMNHDCPTYEQLESFDFWDNGNADDFNTYDYMPDNTADDVREILSEHVGFIVMEHAVERVSHTTEDGEIKYMENGEEIDLSDIEMCPNANAIYKHMYNTIKLPELDAIPELPDEFADHPEVIKFNAICDQLLNEFLSETNW